MSLFLITGLPGSGKTTVWQELKARGYEAYDGEKDHIAYYYNKKTGRAVPRKDEKRTIEFVQTHWRGIPRETIKKLTLKAKGKPVFLCNDPENEDDLRDLFDTIFALVVDEDTIRHRLATRRGKTQWGKVPHELKRVLSSQQETHERYKKFDYVTIDATQPINTVIDFIVLSSQPH